MPGMGATRPPRIFAGILALFGAVLVGGGAWLLGLGGSPYYVVMGTAVLVSAVLLWRGNAVGSAIFQLAVVATLLWAIWEAGFDIWAIAPRVALPLLLMAWLYMPWVRRGLSGTEADDDAPPGGGMHAPKHATAGIAMVLLGGAALLGIQQLQAQEGAAPMNAGGKGSDPATGAHYATLDQINENTVGNLERAWTFDLGTEGNRGASSPVEANGLLFTCTPGGDIAAVDGASGEERWRVSPQSEDAAGNAPCGGLAVHASGAGGACSQRLIGTRGSTLFALDTATGALCTGFGENGVIALAHEAGRPLVAGNTIFTAQKDTGGASLVSAFAAEDGSERWSWRDDDGTGMAILAPLSGDPEIGLVYVATGSPVLRTDGGAPSAFERSFANAVVALDAATGTPRWAFQTTHNDVWNYGLSAQPVLVDLPIPGGTRPALVQATEQGDVFVIDRESGEAISGFTETQAPAGSGLALSGTQPVSDITFRPEALTEQDMWGFTPLDQMMCRIQFRAARYDGPFTPPGTTPVITYPGRWTAEDGNGIAVDQRNKLIVATPSRLATYDRIVAVEGGYEKRSDPFTGLLGAPCNAPPWGMMHLFDLKTTDAAWSEAVGAAPLIPATIGRPGHGPSLVTAGALIFSAMADGRLHAFNLFSGEELWSDALSGADQTAPMTYEAGGRQFIVVASGEAISAYALPGG